MVAAERASLSRFARTAFIVSMVFTLAVPSSQAQENPQVSLETSETLFTILTAINTCGYDQELSSSDPVRTQIRMEVAKAIENIQGASDVVGPMCTLYKRHQIGDVVRELSQYVSLALYLGEPPTFSLKVRPDELPPDAGVSLEVLPAIKMFYEKLGLHAIWLRHQARYNELTQIYHGPLAKMTFETELYLKLPSAGYLGRRFTIYLDAMGAPSQTNARNYADDYYVVISPSADTNIKMQQIRHTYFHYLLDPQALKNAGAFKRVEPLLDNVKNAPMDDAFKTNISLLVTECLVRAIEMRLTKLSDGERMKTLDQDDKEGFVLTRYFYDALTHFEKDPAGIRNTYADMIGRIDVNQERKRASMIEYAKVAAPELLHAARPQNELLAKASQRLAFGDLESAKQLAQQALDQKRGDTGRALFILAQVAVANRDMDGARGYFENALNTTHEQKVLAWSHIYLGRIYDLREDRSAAVDQYRAAIVAAGAELPEVKLAAQKGIDAPYEPPVPKQPE
jgi:hypothetical protein